MIKKILKWTAIILGILFLAIYALSYTSPQTWGYKSATFKGEPLIKNESLEYSSFSKEKLSSFREYLKSAPTTGMVVLENGKVIFEYGDIEEVSYIASCRKSVLSMLYGKYVDEGIIDLEETIGEMGIDEDDGLLPIERKATVKDIITSRSGVFHIPSNGGYDVNNIRTRGSVKPGEYFVYNNWDFNVAGHILELKSGNSVYEEVEQQLALPLGFQDWNIENQSRKIDKSKSRYSAYHIHISTRDMAKIGQLMLQKGNWKGKQIIPGDWTQTITTPFTPRDTVNARNGFDRSSPVQYSYGYMWWLFEEFYNDPDLEGAYTASGYGGQYITVIPKRNLVVAHKTTMDLLSLLGYSRRKFTLSWDYWEILRRLMEDQ